MIRRGASRYPPAKELRKKFQELYRQRHKRNEALGTYTQSDIDEKLKEQWNRCYYCFSPLTFYEVDHIIPLFRGGSNCKDNVVPACFECNRQKGYKFVFEWLRQSKCRAKRRLDNISPGKFAFKS